MPAHIPHTYRSSTGTYFFRYVFPARLRELYPCLGRDIRLSLKTKLHAEAKLLVYQYAANVNKCIDILETYYHNVQLGLASLFQKVMLDRYDIDISDIALFTLNGDESCNSPHAGRKKDFYMLMELVKHTHIDGSITTFSADSIESNLEALAFLKAKEHYYTHRLLKQDGAAIPLLGASFDEAFIPDDLHTIESFGAEPAPEIPDDVWDYLISNQTQACNDVDITTNIESGMAPASDALVVEPEPTPEPAPEPVKALTLQGEKADIEVEAASDQPRTITFTALAERFFADGVIEGTYKEGSGTLNKYRSYMKNIVEVIGADTLVHTLTPAKIMEIRNTILVYPKYRNSGARKDRSLEDLLADPSVARLKKDTASEYFDRLNNVLDHGYILGYLTTNPADKVKIKKVKGRCGTGEEDDQVSRNPFTDEDLIDLLNGYIYHGRYNVAKRKLYDAHFWVPLIAMYTGMRVGEICQLQLSDIHTEGKRWHGRVFNHPYIQVCAEHRSQNVKNKNAVRKVPIHPRLIEIGFLDYVELRRREAGGRDGIRLFRHMKWELKSKWGRVISRWFNGDGDAKKDGYKHKVLNPNELEGKVFHSFRHTAIDILRSTLGPKCKPVISALMGHEETGSSASYGEGYQLDQLSEALYTLRYSDEVEALVSSLKFDDFVQKQIDFGMNGSERRTPINWDKMVPKAAA